MRAIALLCRVRSQWFLYRLGTFLGDLTYLLPLRLRRVALSNLRRAYPQFSPAEIRRLCRSNLRLFGKNLVEFLHSPCLSREDIRSRVKLQGLEFLHGAFKQGKGVICLTAHFGNWEWMGARITADGFPLAVIARPHDDPATSAFIDSIRIHNGLKVIPRHDVRAALRSLRRQEILAVLADQHAGKAGIPVPFFGRPASTFPGIAALALRSGAPIIPCFIVRMPDNTHVATICPPVQLISGDDTQETIRANVALCTKIIEDQIRCYPDHWMWIHNRWKS